LWRRERSPMPGSHLVHVVDDDVDVRKSLGFLLATADFAVRLYESATAFLATATSNLDGCIVTDVRMPGIDGIEFLRQLRSRGHSVPVIVMTGHADVALAVQAMKEGASDFIEKPFDDEVLIEAIRSALGSRNQADAAHPQSSEIRGRLSALSERERQVLDGLVSGLPNKTIAYDLGISPRTVEIHRANVMSKMAASSLSHLVRMALIVESKR
jgi:two-component system, LuxR family, response regulator FixJ